MRSLILCLALCATVPLAFAAGTQRAAVASQAGVQRDPFNVTVNVTFPESVRTVGQAVDYLLARVGYQVAEVCLDVYVLAASMQQPLPSVYRTMEAMPLEIALKVLVGADWILVVDPVSRLVSFDPSTLDHAPMPLNTVWTLDPKLDLRENLNRWFSRAGWTLVWQVKGDIPLDAGADFYGTLDMAVEQVVAALNAGGITVGSEQHSNNTIRVFMAR